MTNDSKHEETRAAFKAIGQAIQDAADDAQRKALVFTQALAAYDRRLKRDGLWPSSAQWKLPSAAGRDPRG